MHMLGPDMTSNPRLQVQRETEALPHYLTFSRSTLVTGFHHWLAHSFVLGRWSTYPVGMGAELPGLGEFGHYRGATGRDLSMPLKSKKQSIIIIIIIIIIIHFGSSYGQPSRQLTRFPLWMRSDGAIGLHLQGHCAPWADAGAPG